MFVWMLLIQHRYLLEFTFSRTCDLERNIVSLNISDIVGLGNLVRWPRLTHHHTEFYTQYLIEPEYSDTYFAFINIAWKRQVERDQSQKSCDIIVQKSLDNSQLMSHVLIPPLFENFSQGMSSGRNRFHFFHTRALNLSWYNVGEICDKLSTGHYQVSHFMYLSEQELETVINKLSRLSLLDGSSWLIFTGFTGKSVRLCYHLIFY